MKQKRNGKYVYLMFQLAVWKCVVWSRGTRYILSRIHLYSTVRVYSCGKTTTATMAMMMFLYYILVNCWTKINARIQNEIDNRFLSHNCNTSWTKWRLTMTMAQVFQFIFGHVATLSYQIGICMPFRLHSLLLHYRRKEYKTRKGKRRHSLIRSE